MSTPQALPAEQVFTDTALDAARTVHAAATPIAVVIPAYNEAATIAAVVAGARRHTPRVIVVDDGSSDATARLAVRSGAALVSGGANRGKSCSLLYGARLALHQGARQVITLDADGQHDPADIPRLLAAAAAHPRAIIVGSRLRKRARMPRRRRFGNMMANFWISWAAGYRIDDTQSGFRCYPAQVFADLPPHRYDGRGFVLESEILIDAAYAGIFVHPVAVDAVYPREARPSHYRAVIDTLLIVRMVAAKLLTRCLYPVGLLRSLGCWFDKRPR